MMGRCERLNAQVPAGFVDVSPLRGGGRSIRRGDTGGAGSACCQMRRRPASGGGWGFQGSGAYNGGGNSHSKGFQPPSQRWRNGDEQSRGGPSSPPRTDSNEGSDSASDADALLKRLQASEAAAVKSEAQYDQLLREFDNYRKRMANERVKQDSQALASVVKEMLPLLDALERGAASASRQTGESDGEDRSSLSYVQLERMMLTALQRLGVQPISAVGEEFDPFYHTAVKRASSKHPEGFVCEQYGRGYKINDVVVRPAITAVSDGTGDILAKDDDDDDDDRQSASTNQPPAPSPRKKDDKPSDDDSDSDGPGVFAAPAAVTEPSSSASKQEPQEGGRSVLEVPHEVNDVRQMADSEITQLSQKIDLLTEQLKASLRHGDKLEASYDELRQDFEYFRKQAVQTLIDLSTRNARTADRSNNDGAGDEESEWSAPPERRPRKGPPKRYRGGGMSPYSGHPFGRFF